MKRTRLTLSEVVRIELALYVSDRGFLLEGYNERRFQRAIGHRFRFVQDNHSRSVQGVLWALHHQIRRLQGKPVPVAAAEVFDVPLYLRKSSAKFGKWGVECCVIWNQQKAGITWPAVTTPILSNKDRDGVRLSSA